jgi:hypothetical protein
MVPRGGKKELAIAPRSLRTSEASFDDTFRNMKQVKEMAPVKPETICL